MNRWNVLKIAVVAIALSAIDHTAFGASQRQTTQPASLQQVSNLSQTRDSSKVPDSFSISPAALVLGAMMVGTVLVLVSGIGHESLNSIDFERAYRESHKSTTAAVGH